MILVYHHVCPPDLVPADASLRAAEGWTYSIAPGEFRLQLEKLRARGFRFVTMDEYVRTAVEENRGAGRMVTVTFDDGWIDNYEFAWPILQQTRIPATWFVVSGAMPGVGADRRMSTSMLRELMGSDMTIGAHSRTHPNLTTLPEPALRAELAGCRADLEREFGRPVEFLAYPGGRFNPLVKRVAMEAGYRAACSVLPAGVNDGGSRFQLSRDVLTPGMHALRDSLLLSPTGRWVWRLARQARAIFPASAADSTHPIPKYARTE